MELVLQESLEHQQKAVDAVCDVFKDVQPFKPIQYYENPHLDINSDYIIRNIEDVQKELKVQPEFRNVNIPGTDGTMLSLDIKMETGTGKTYVYAKTMYELHHRYGLNKFIIVVPSLAIKAGTASFLADPYVQKHFKDSCHYGADLCVGIVEANKNTKKGRTFFPHVVDDFIRGSCQDKNKIYVLILNMQLLMGNAKL
ncbi:MAG: DEAD/DEAH box helicase family protein, partial [Phascolarctobacterium sp.]|nr:DEAD/DEAH box helicase family protein [Candidatus Phascolarctobacterium caballi]